jgi:glycosyltransferase involved in cell wall biosynthesis
VTRVRAVVAARDEADLIADTVRALRAIVADVVVVDDGSVDATAEVARSAGVTVLRRGRAGGKGGAVEHALRSLPAADVWLLADGDLGASATCLREVLEPVLRGETDLAVAVFPPGPGGGFGLVKRAARRCVRWLGGIDVREPLSGQRAITADALERVRPLARGFGLETAMTIDAARAGLRILEVPVPVSHRPTFRDPRGFAHRGRQGWEIVRAVAPRALGRR